jgi:hypothetical protein
MISSLAPAFLSASIGLMRSGKKQLYSIASTRASSIGDCG